MSEYKAPKTTFISFEEYESEDFHAPSKYYIRTATGVEFIHCRDRVKANEYIKEVWDNKYNLRVVAKAQIR